MKSIQTKSRKRQKMARKEPKPGTTLVDRRLLAKAASETAEGSIPPGPEEFIRKQLRGVPRQQALRYLGTVLDHARNRVIESLPKRVLDIKPPQYPAFGAINAIEVVRHGLRLLGSAEGGAT